MSHQVRRGEIVDRPQAADDPVGTGLEKHALQRQHLVGDRLVAGRGLACGQDHERMAAGLGVEDLAGGEGMVPARNRAARSGAPMVA